MLIILTQNIFSQSIRLIRLGSLSNLNKERNPLVDFFINRRLQEYVVTNEMLTEGLSHCGIC